MSKMFISYRRDDTADVAKQIYDGLVLRLPDDDIYLDVDTIQYGENFLASIERHVINADVVLVLIGPHWNGLPGQRRLLDVDDYVRLEVELALRHSKQIIPILVGSYTNFPPEGELPSSLSAFHLINGVRVARTIASVDLDRLTRTVSRSQVKQAPGVSETVSLKIENMQIIKGDSEYAIEALVHNDSTKEVLVTGATIGSWRPDLASYFMSPPRYTYELNLEAVALKGRTDKFSIQGKAGEPEDDWKRPASGYFLRHGGHIEFVVSFSMYLQVAPKEHGLLRFILRKPVLISNREVIAGIQQQDQAILKVAPTIEVAHTDEEIDRLVRYHSGNTWMILEGDWGQPIAAKLSGTTLLQLFISGFLP